MSTVCPESGLPMPKARLVDQVDRLLEDHTDRLSYQELRGMDASELEDLFLQLVQAHHSAYSLD